ncbi:MAG TPA: hypothetical protein VF198_05295 [Vicinamibacterales bacterium]
MAQKAVLKAARGYEFVKRGTRVMLRHKATGSTGMSLTCGCQVEGGSGGKGCKIVIDGDEASCLSDGCKQCSWEIKIPGLVAARVFARPILRGPSR